MKSVGWLGKRAARLCILAEPPETVRRGRAPGRGRRRREHPGGRCAPGRRAVAPNERGPGITAGAAELRSIGSPIRAGIAANPSSSSRQRGAALVRVLSAVARPAANLLELVPPAPRPRAPTTPRAPSTSSTSTIHPFSRANEIRGLSDTRRHERDTHRHRLERRSSARLRHGRSRGRGRSPRMRPQRSRYRAGARGDTATRARSSPALTYPRAGPGEQEPRARERALAAVRRRRARTSGPLMSFGSSPSPQPTPSFWKEPTTNAESGMLELSPRVRIARSAIGRETPRGRCRSGCGGSSPGDARLEHELFHRTVRHLNPIDVRMTAP